MGKEAMGMGASSCRPVVAISLSKNQRTTPNRKDKQPARWTGHNLCPPGTMKKNRCAATTTALVVRW
jgi:hypothetical protein